MRFVRGAAAFALAATTWGWFAGAPAATSPPLPPRGADAWWFRSLDIGDAHRQVTGKGVTVALIDGPIAPDVPELRGRNVVPVVNVCGGEPTGTGDVADHTTALATTIVGSGTGNADDGIGTAGIAPDASLRVYAVGESVTRVGCGRDGFDGAATAIERAVADGVRIIGYAGGSEHLRPTLEAAVQRALNAGIVVVAATGDSRDHAVLNPAAIPGVVAVSAVDRAGAPWSENTPGNREAFVISAPGVDLPMGGFFDESWRSAALRTGTSEATAIVMGGLALAMERWPQATGNQIVAALIHTATRGSGTSAAPSAAPSPGPGPASPGLPARDTDFGFGVLSIDGMLAADPGQWPDVNPLRPPNPTPTPTPIAFAPTGDEGLGWVVPAGAVAGTAVLLTLFIAGRARRRQPSGRVWP